MPPRPSGTLSTTFSPNDPTNEIVCALVNQDGSQCRKRCFGDKRFRSMQEHIRRAHPEHYIPKLPASGESIRAMVEKIPDERPLSQQTSPQQLPPPQRHDTSSYSNASMFAPNHLRRGSLLQSANAAAALAQLHNSRPEPDWQGHQDSYGGPDAEHDFSMNNYFSHSGVTPDMFGDSNNDMDSNILQPPFDRSYFSRSGSSTMPSAFSRRPTNRPRKSSVTENARKGKHERDKSKDLAKRLSHDRKGMSLEPGHKRWEDLLDAAQSATEEESRDLTPIPQSPRSSMPPFNSTGGVPNQFQSYTASPLQNTLLPQESTDDNNSSFNPPGLEPFPSVESSYDAAGSQQPYSSHQHQASGESAHSNMFSPYGAARHHASSTGSNFHMPPEGLSSSSPGNTPQLNHHFARPDSSSANASHYPHSLNTAALAHAANQHQRNQQHPYSAHHASFSAASTAVAGGPSTHMSEPVTPQVEHYCAACKRGTPLVQSYGCTECMCGICRECFEVLTTMDPERSNGCPHCHVRNGKYKPFMLDLR